LRKKINLKKVKNVFFYFFLPAKMSTYCSKIGVLRQMRIMAGVLQSETRQPENIIRGHMLHDNNQKTRQCGCDWLCM
jgi:hypothetical protein